MSVDGGGTIDMSVARDPSLGTYETLSSKVRELRALLATGVDLRVAESKRRQYERCLAMLEEEMPGARITELLRFELEGLSEFPPSGYD
jgi:hypothetical protein